MINLTRPLVLAPLTILLLASGCNTGPGNGDIVVNYRFGGAGTSCESEAVETVEALLLNSNGETVESESAACNTSEPLEINSVEAGTYQLVVNGIAADAFTVRDNLDIPSGDDRAEVIGGSSQEVDVTLTPTPATLRFRWKIFTDDGSPIPNCDDAVPQAFEIVAYEGTSALSSEMLRYCDTAPGFQALADEDRDIDGEDLDSVVVRILDGSGDELALVEFPFESPGAGRTVDFDIQCDGVNCRGDIIGGASRD